jgi:predicted RNA-binding protein with PUA-like domain
MYWLMKSEPSTYSIDDLARDRVTRWEGVRSFQARNFMRDQMKVGDLVLFYHSSAEPPGVAGIARVASAAYADPTQFQKKSPYYDATSKESDARWSLVDVEFVEKLPEILSLDRLKRDAALAGMLVLAKGQRISVLPVSDAHFRRVLALANAKTEPSSDGGDAILELPMVKAAMARASAPAKPGASKDREAKRGAADERRAAAKKTKGGPAKKTKRGAAKKAKRGGKTRPGFAGKTELGFAGKSSRGFDARDLAEFARTAGESKPAKRAKRG